MDIHVGKVVGRMEGGVWGQIHDFTPEDETKQLNKGRLIAVVSRMGENEGSLRSVAEGREILARLHELYFGPFAGETPGLVGVKNALVSLGEEFPEVEAEVVVVVGEVVYVAVLGQGGVWVKTAKNEGWIVPCQERGGTMGLSGRITEDKILVVGNKAWWNEVTLPQIRMAIDKGDLEAGMEMLAAVVHGGGGIGGEVGAVIKFKTQDSKLNDQINSNPQEIKPKIENETKKPGLWTKMKEKLPKANLNKKEGPVYVTYEDRGKKRKRTRIIAAGFAALLLGIGLAGRVRLANQNKRNDENNKLAEDMIYKFREAKGVAELNPARSQQLIPTIQEELTTLEARKVNDPRIAEVRGGLGEVLGLATGVKKVEINEIMDLGLVRDGMTGNGMAISDDKLVVVDKTADRVAMIDPIKINGKVIAGKDGVGAIKGVAGYPGKIEVLSDKGIVECSLLNTPCSVKIENDPGWGQITDIKVFAGNVYLLDTGSGDIWRYQGNGDVFGRKQTWLADDGSKSAIKFAKNMAIDGSIWVIGGGGNLMKITSGVKEDVTVSGWDKPWGQNVMIYTDDATENLYVLDRDNGRILVIKKTGEYQMQLVADGLKTMEDMVVVEADKKIYLTGGTKVWEISL
jgi:hypothetical protein